MNLRQMKEVYWDVRKQPDQALRILLEPLVPSYRAHRKYQSELDYWRRYLLALRAWYEDGVIDWGVPPPTKEQKVVVSDLWATNALVTRHQRCPMLFEELMLASDAFRGRRVLEVGCGPSAPILQFADCERHGIDPLIDKYIKAGWPLFDLDVTFVNAYAEDMPYGDGYFDAVISRNALDHVDDFARTAAEIGRVLKPDGGIFFSVEYHKPTLNEPQQLDDASVTAAFGHLDVKKVGERGKNQLNRDLARRFDLLLPDLLTTAGADHGELYVVWHGRKPSRM
jgi:SAM-dependent methyltransferase